MVNLPLPTRHVRSEASSQRGPHPQTSAKSVPPGTRTPLCSITWRTQRFGQHAAIRVPRVSRAKSRDFEEKKLHDIHLIFNQSTGSKLRDAYRCLYNRSVRDIRFTCAACLQTILRRAPHPRVRRNYAPWEAICSDIAGPFHPPSSSGEKYFFSIIDVGTRFAAIMPLASLTQALPHIFRCLLKFKEIFYEPPRLLVTDSAREYVSKAVQSLHDEFDITFRPKTPQKISRIMEYLSGSTLQS